VMVEAVSSIGGRLAGEAGRLCERWADGQGECDRQGDAASHSRSPAASLMITCENVLPVPRSAASLSTTRGSSPIQRSHWRCETCFG
jgi:hypothetical protein